MQEEQRLEAPINDRPSTPGVGASLPPVDNVDVKDKTCDEVKSQKEEVTIKVNDESSTEDAKSQLSVCNTIPDSDTKVDKKLQTPLAKESSKINETAVDEEIRQIKSPIKILKNSEGHYEVLRPCSNNQTSPESRNNYNEKKSHNPEFSVVSIGEGPNSNGVKIKLKQCSPGNLPSKPKNISKVPMRNGQTEKALKLQEKSHKKELVDKQEKHKRKVTFVDKVVLNKTDNETNNSNKTLIEQSDKKQFLHEFQLTAKQSWDDQSAPNKNPKDMNSQNPVPNSLNKSTDDIVKKSSEKQDKCKIISDEKINNQLDSGIVNLIKNKTAEKASTFSLKINHSYNSKRFINGALEDLNASDKDPKIDVYAFPSEPPTLPAGAVKRKCPPGLPIFDVERKRPHLQGQIRKKTPSMPLSPVKNAKKQDTTSPPKKLPNSNDNSPPGINCSTHHNTVTSRIPASAMSDNTRNLLDGCGLNIPASLSITLTAPKSPSNGSSSADSKSLKDKQILSGKVNPSITLNDRSVDPRVLKALKTGQIRMPVPTGRPKAKPASERNQLAKRKRDDTRDILDLSGTKKSDIHPLRIPQPISKFKSKPTRENMSAHPASSQVVTLTGGQKYYRAPPGSLTPAVHRVADYPQSPPSRAPVYAPSCFSTPLNSSRSSNNISSVFPSLQSLYALSQAPNLQQFQMDNRLRLPQADHNASNGLGKSHLAAQCAPLKPARSSFSSLAVPMVKQSPTSRPMSLTAGITQVNDVIKQKGINKSDMTAKRDNSQNISTGKRSPLLINSNINKDTEKGVEKCSRSSSSSSPSPMSPHSKQEASTPNGAEINSHEAASPRVSSTVSPSPPPLPRNPSVNVSKAHEFSSVSNSNKSGSEVTSSKSPESPDSSSVVNEHSNNPSGIALDQSQPSPKEDKLDTIKEPETQPKSTEKADENITRDSDDKKTDNINVDEKQMTSEVFQKRLLAAFPSKEWANNPIAAKHLGNLLKSLNSMQTIDQTEISKKVESDNSCESMIEKCITNISSKIETEVTD